MRNLEQIPNLELVWPERLERIRRSQARSDPTGMTRPPRDPVEREFLAARGQLGPFVEAPRSVDPMPIEEWGEPEWVEWAQMTPEERWAESTRLLDQFLALGGSLEPEPDIQSPFFDAREWRPMPSDGWPGVRTIRRSGV